MFFEKLIRRGFIQHLAALSVGLASCPGDASELIDLPDEVVEEILDDVVDAGWCESDRKVALILAAEDPRRSIRLRAARAIAASGLGLDELEPLLLRLVSDDEAEVRSAAGESVAKILLRSSELERTAVISDWATAESPRVRLAIASALSRPITAVDLAMVLEVLSIDPVAEVRFAVTAAARARIATEPELFSSVISRQLADLDPERDRS